MHVSTTMRSVAGLYGSPGFERAMMVAMEEAKDALVTSLRAGQEPPNAPYSDLTARRKQGPGWLYETGKFAESLVPMKVEGTPPGVYVVGLAIPTDPTSGSTDNSTRNMQDLAHMMVYGITIKIRGEARKKALKWLFANGILDPAQMGDRLEDQRYQDTSNEEMSIVIPPRGELIPPAARQAMSIRAGNVFRRYLRDRARAAAVAANTGSATAVRAATEAVVPRRAAT